MVIILVVFILNLLEVTYLMFLEIFSCFFFSLFLMKCIIFLSKSVFKLYHPALYMM